MAAVVERNESGGDGDPSGCGPAQPERLTVTLKVKRFNPEVDDKPHWQAS